MLAKVSILILKIYASQSVLLYIFPQAFFAKQLYEKCDTDGNGAVGLEEMVQVTVELQRAPPREKLKFFFDIYDINGMLIINATLCFIVYVVAPMQYPLKKESYAAMIKT